jgi:hypothetical protein
METTIDLDGGSGQQGQGKRVTRPTNLSPKISEAVRCPKIFRVAQAESCSDAAALASCYKEELEK